jgi:lipoyl(octanoyl) transferase
VIQKKTIAPKIKFKTNNSPEEYKNAVDFMEEYVAKITSGFDPELIWLTSHKPLYTAGISSKEEDLLLINPHRSATQELDPPKQGEHNPHSSTLIDFSKIPVYKTNRGGKYTYHDDGMRIIYVMLNLKNVFAPEKPDVAKFVEMLENWVIAVLARIGIKGEIRKDRVGIWVECEDENGNKCEKKIAAMGIKIRKWISYHGIAININPNLAGFSGIVPCGLKDFGVTSIFDLGKKISFEEIDEIIKEEFFKVFENYQPHSSS